MCRENAHNTQSTQTGTVRASGAGTVKQNLQHARTRAGKEREREEKMHHSRRVLKSFKFNCFVCTESRDIPFDDTRWPWMYGDRCPPDNEIRAVIVSFSEYLTLRMCILYCSSNRETETERVRVRPLVVCVCVRVHCVSFRFRPRRKTNYQFHRMRISKSQV